MLDLMKTDCLPLPDHTVGSFHFGIFRLRIAMFRVRFLLKSVDNPPIDKAVRIFELFCRISTDELSGKAGSTQEKDAISHQ